MEISLEATALLVVDMQNGMCKPEGSHARLGLDIAMLAGAIAPCRKLVGAAHAAGALVCYSYLAYEPDYSDGGFIVREMMPNIAASKVCQRGSWDAEIVEELAPQPGDIVIEKSRMSSFMRTDLEKRLRDRGIVNLVVCGVTTNMCVESTVRDASQLDFRTFVVRDAVGEVDPARHDASLTSMGFLFAKLVTADDVIAAFSERAAA
ncbi:MAG: cysteine hydrolase, partial [Proteobacteria bacterium]|nr:cysteine hydrolase [Pseudomonadota bacterium]